MRYNQLLDLVKERKPQVIVEIGTFDGRRAIQMFNAYSGMHYIGFDLFDDASKHTDMKEKNVKPHFSIKKVMKNLDDSGMQATLIRGDTNVTFTKWANKNHGIVDLVYIDGGHSVETIQSDYENALKCLKPGGAIVFDDYYDDMQDIDKFGANRVLESSGRDYEVLPIADPIAGGHQNSEIIGFTKMAVMYP